MKKILFVFLFFTFHSSFLNADPGWFSQASGTLNHLRAVYFSNLQNGWIAGDTGKILYTSNGGMNWTPQISGTIYSLRSLYFVDLQTAWAAGDAGKILKTTNGGVNWFTQATIYNAFSCIFFINSQTGWVCGYGGAIYKTTNGGTNWNLQTSGTTNWILSIFFTDSQNGWATGYSGTVLTNNKRRNILECYTNRRTILSYQYLLHKFTNRLDCRRKQFIYEWNYYKNFKRRIELGLSVIREYKRI